jgi:hypothetical protein
VYEVTLDFVRVDHDSGRRYLAARVAVPLDATTDLKLRLDKIPDWWRTRTGRLP